ncbi:hypothetical protein [Undibacterium sp. TS12]|uniref:hypothetical protein n=1 Tax=Undibacterium sp. TS12 TaxID=2908202 RepID=UPI001F4C5F10|nr:hypothetical protein [Undibacterium sp. TS12]MCH8618026.1 hypothetical protein [Undibacterium sp. TS12]
MKTILKHLMIIGILLTASLAQAAAPTPEMKQALKEFIEVQNLEQAWIIIIENAAKNGSEEVVKGAMRKLESSSSLSEVERTRIKNVILEMTPKIANEVTAFHKNLDVKTMVTEMIEAIYPKYYNVQEIRDLTMFYGSMAFRKTAIFGREIATESAITGESKRVLWRRYDSKFTPQETKQKLEFASSAIGLKQNAIGAKVNAECLDFFYNRTTPELLKIADRYGEVLAKRLNP